MERVHNSAHNSDNNVEELDEEPPDNRICFILFLLGAIVFFIIGLIIGSSFIQTKQIKQDATTSQESLIQNNTLIGYSNPSIVKSRIMAYMGTDYPQVLGKLTDKIIFCESSGNPKAYNKKSGAKGLLQVIPKSQKFCEQGLGIKLDMFNPDDNLLCAQYLYEHGGLKHWEASEKCWKK